MAGQGRVAQRTGFSIAQAAQGQALPDPLWQELLPLPGAGGGVPLFISNNPEIFEGTGLLAGTRQPPKGERSMRGQLPTLTNFGVYLFHINRSGGTKRVHVLVSPSEGRAVKARVRGALNANAWAIGNSSSVATARALITQWPIDREIELQANTATSLGFVDVGQGKPVDGRFAVEADGGLFIRDVATAAGTEAPAALGVGSASFAHGHIARPASDKFGRCAGLYQFDRWDGKLDVRIEKVPQVVGYRFDEKEQAFPSLATYEDSDQRATANYGAVYHLEVNVENAAGADAVLGVQFASYPALYAPDAVAHYVEALRKKKIDIPTRIWDGPLAVDIDKETKVVPILTRPLTDAGQPSPAAMRAPILSQPLGKGKTLSFTLRIPVPGLISIPAAILIRASGTTAAAQASAGGGFPVG